MVPDAMCELRYQPSGEAARVLRLAFEIDLGSERTSVLRDKLIKYRSAVTSPGGLFGWTQLALALILGNSSARRKRSIAQLVDDCWGSHWIAWPESRGFSAAIPQVLALLDAPLTDSPCLWGHLETANDYVSLSYIHMEPGLLRERTHCKRIQRPGE